MNNEQKILACVDATPAADGVAAYAAWAAVRLQAPLEFLHVLGRAGASSSTGGAELSKHLEWVVRSVNLPVLVAAPVYAEPSRVLFAFDGSSVTRRGVAMLAASPLLQGLPIHLVMSGDANAQGQRYLTAAVQALQGAGLEASSALIPGNPQDAIAATLKDPSFNLLVMGAYSHSPLRQLFLGSKTSDLLKASRVATLLLR